MNLSRGLPRLIALLGFAVVLAVVPASAGADQADQYWTAGDTAYIEQTIVPQLSPPNTFFALQAFMTGPGQPGSPALMYIGLQNPGGAKRVLFSMWNANGWYGTNCEEFHGEGDGLHCWQPFDYQDHQPYRVRIQRKHSDADGTWWEATILDAAGNSTYIAALREPGAPTTISSTVSFVEYFGPDGCVQPARAFFLPTRFADWGVYSSFSGRGSIGPCAAPTYDPAPTYSFGYGGVSLAIGGG